MMTPKSDIHLARLWIALEDVRHRIDNEIVPLGMHLKLEDPELTQALETLSKSIESHFERWHLAVEPRSTSAKKVGAKGRSGVK